MTEFKKPLAAALALCLATLPAFAQDATAPAAPTEPPAATEAPAPAATETPAPADGPGTSYIANTFDDWQMQCFRTEEGKDPCQIYQLLHDANGSNVADISMVALPDGGKASAGATIMTPLETLLTANLQLKVDNGEPKVYPYTFCAPPGCFARIGLIPDELAQFKRGNKVTMTIVPLATPGQPVNVEISLKGFTAAYDAVAKNNAALQPQQ